MSWNEPGNRDEKNKKRDPWGTQGQEPPSLDEVWRRLQAKLQGLLGARQSPRSHSTTPKDPTSKMFGVSLFVGLLLLGYVLAGIYVVGPAERAVVLRLGHYVGTQLPGPHWIAPIIETKYIVNVDEVKAIKHGGQMLTKDENIVSAEIAVQYRVSNPSDYLFNLVNPVLSLKQVSESALRAVVGQSTLNEVLTSGRSEIGAEIRKQVQLNLNNYKAGIEISDLAMQQTKAPDQVRAAFDDAIKAQQDEERFVNEAQAYSLKIIPIAEGNAKRTIEEGKAYREQVILNSQGKNLKIYTNIARVSKIAARDARATLFRCPSRNLY